MDIKKFHELYWSDKITHIEGYLNYSVKPLERRYNDRNPNFDPHYSTLYNLGNAREMEKLFDKYEYVQSFHGKKFVLGDYTFYGYAGQTEHSDFYKGQTKTGFTFIMDYHGYRRYVMYFEKYIYDERAGIYKGNYGKEYNGIQEFLDLLNDFDGDLIDYDMYELLNKDVKKKFILKPSQYPTTGNYKPIGEIDFDHFVMMETKDGIYKPSMEVTTKILDWEWERVLKAKTPKLKDLGIHTVQLRNNSAFSINDYYDLEGIEIKASKSTLKGYPKLLKYSKNDDIKTKIKEENDIIKKQKELEIYNDSYTLSQHGKVIFENIRSHEISNYFANKEYKDFELGIIKAGEKVFEAAPELTKIFFMTYGIYSYTELSGEKFASSENFESINKNKKITVPKRILTLISSGTIEPPTFDTDGKLFTFERGATYIGAKIKNGKVVMITESGDQGI